MKIGVAKETAPGERRVALVPEALGKLKAAGLDILVERGAGAGSSFPDAEYEAAGATIVSTDDLYRGADAILRVAKPSSKEVGKLRKGQALLGLLSPLIDPKTAKELADRGVTAISLDAIPRTLSRAQTMDALSSQANVGGYKAVLIAANEYGRYFPLLTTAPSRRAVPIACSPATPMPRISTFAGLAVPAAVVRSGKYRPNASAAMITAL